MQEQEHRHHPLRKEIPGHLFQFEEKIFGMRLEHLLSDLAAAILTLSLTASLPLPLRAVTCLSILIVTLICVHGTIGGYPTLSYLFLIARSWSIPSRTVWRPRHRPAQKGEPGSIQEAWIQPNELAHGVMGYIAPRKKQAEEPAACYWVALEVESMQQVRHLTEGDQVRLYERFKSLLDGLGFPLKFLSLVDQADPQSHPALLAQREAVRRLAATPRLQRVQQASLALQHAALQESTMVRHFLIVGATSRELARLQSNDTSGSRVARLWKMVARRTSPPVTREQVREQVRIRLSIVQKALHALEVRATILEDQQLLQTFASCLALGAHPSSYEQNQATDEHSNLSLADLVAPSSVTVGPDVVEVTVGGQPRYQRYVEVTGFPSELLCGWQEELLDLGLPMLIMTHCDPINSRMMIKKLEWELTKLESQRLSDQKTLRIPRADRQIEAEQVKRLRDALARKTLTMFAVQMVIGVHAGSRVRLEQRTRYLLSHLHEMQVRVRPMRHRQDLAWQACLPTCLDTGLTHFITLPSDALSTCMSWSTGTIGTPSGAYLGSTGSGLRKRPVYFQPWDETKRLPNPHVVICGESGMGKSWLVKTLIMGLLGTGVADAVVLDRDGDYDALHTFLGEESQRFNLAAGCPVNIMELPYGPDDVQQDDPTDVLAECIDNHLLVGLALLYGEPLSKAQEGFLTHAAREAYGRKGISSQAIQHDPRVLLREPPTFADLIQAMKEVPTASESMRLTLLERFEHVAYLFPGQTSVQIHAPLTILNIHMLDEKWYGLMMYVVHNFLQRHRSLQRDDRYLAYVVEEASYLLKHPAGRRYLEMGSRGFRKRGIAQLTLSQHPEDFLKDGKVIIGNAGTCFFLGMQPHVAQSLHLPEALERVLAEGVPGRAVMRCGREYAAITVATSLLHRILYTTDPGERRLLRQRHQQRRA